VKGIDHVIKKTAIQLNLSEDKVKVIVMEYWSTIYTRILKLDTTTVTARHLGSFTISRYKLNNLIIKTIGKIKRVTKTDNLSKEKKDEILQNEYNKLSVALKRRNDLAVMYKETNDLKIKK